MSDYQKGYAAGRRRAALENERQHMLAMRDEFERQVFLAVLPELIRSPWQKRGETWKTMKEFVDGAQNFADMASKRFAFTVPPQPLPPGDPA